MPKATRKPSPARSQGDLLTPRRRLSRSTRSVGSPARSDASGKLTALLRDKIMDSFALSPLPERRSILTDDTNIEEPRRKSWWKKLSENSRDVIELLENNKVPETDVIEEYIDIEVLSQQKNKYTNDLPESSDSESINSIVIPQRKLLTQKESQPQKKFGQLVGNRETLAKLNKSNAGQDKTINAGTKNLFQHNKQRSKPVFPSELLNISPNSTASDKTKQLPVEPPNNQIRNIFGNRPATKRKNIFTEFIMSDSEEEIPEIQPKIFGFQKKTDPKKSSNSTSKKREQSPFTLNFTTDEMDDWKQLPSSTMVDNQLEDTITATPVKKSKLSKLSEAKGSEGTNANNMIEDKRKQSNQSVTLNNKSKLSNHENSSKINISRRSRSKSDAKLNKSQNKTISKFNERNEFVTPTSATGRNRNHIVSQNKSQTRNKTSIINTSKQINQADDSGAEDLAETAGNDQIQHEDENNFTLQYEHVEHDSIVTATTTNDKSITDKCKNLSTNKNVSIRKDSDDEATGSEIQRTFQSKSEKSVEETEESENLDENEQSSIDLQDSERKNKTVREYEQVVTGSNKQVILNDIDCNQQIQHNGANNSAVNQPFSAMEVDDAYEDEIVLDVSNELQYESQLDYEEMEQDECNEIQNEESQELCETQISLNQSQKVQNKSENKDKGNKVLNDNDERQKLQNNSKIGLEAQIERQFKEKNQEMNDNDEDKECIKVPNENGHNEENQESHNECEENNINQEIESETEENHEIESDTEENHEIESDTEENQELESDTEENQELENDTEENQKLENDFEENHELQIDTEEDQELENDTEENQELENGSEENQELENDTKENQELENYSDKNQDLENDNEVNQELENTTEENQEPENDTSNNEEIESETEENHEYESDTEENHEYESDTEQNQGNENESNEKEESQERIDSQDNAEDSNEVQSENDESENEVEDHQALQYESEDDIQNESHSREKESDIIECTESPNDNEEIHSPETILKDKTNHIHSFTAHDHNTTARKTKSLHKSLFIRPSMAPPRESTGMSDGAGNSSAGSGWDSHRITRKTIRQTFGNDYTTRKSLRALVMEKSAKRQTAHNEMHSITVNQPQANSTELPQVSNYYEAEDDTTDMTDHEALKKTRQATLEECLRKIQERNLKMRLEAEEKVRNSLKAKPKDMLNPFKMPNRPTFAARRPAKPKNQRKPKNGQINSLIPFDDLPPEVLEDFNYKPPKRFHPSNASWITKRLYKYLETKLEPRYDYKARVRAEKLAETLYNFTKEIRRLKVAPPAHIDSLKNEMARLNIVKKHSEFYQFFHDFMPKEVRIKVVPDIVNKLPLPRHGVYTDIIRGNTIAE